MPAIMRPAPTTRPALPPPLLSLLALLTALLACALGCAGEPPATCGAIGRSVSCACPGGIMGAQECGPAGVWSACVCPGSDGGTDAGADAAGDAPQPTPDAPALDALSVDAPLSDAPVDASADAGVDRADVTTDAARDAAGELADAPADRPAPDAPDPLLEQVSAVRVMVIAPGYDWTAARSQSCTVTGGVPSVSADYDAPEPAGFTFLGPSTITYVNGGRGYSDVRAELRAGVEYTMGGTRRVNVQVRGMIPGGLALTMTALGCAVR